MGKTEQILSYLPPLYRPYPQPWLAPRVPSLLYLMANAVGTLMSEADELLVTVMRAHWADFADKGRPTIDDLEKLAALFDLAPRDDEDVETFRTHLKSYVRTYLEGSATPRGILRLAASTLALSLEDPLDPQPGDPPALIVETRPGEDAAFRLFGINEVEVRGVPPGPARLIGSRDLSGGADLSGGSTLRIAVDGDDIATVDVAGANPRATTPWEVARAINAALGVAVAAHNGSTLTITSSAAGEGASVQISAPQGDAADALFGLAPRVHPGATARAASITGLLDHAPAGGIALLDLRGAHYLRIAIDGKMPVEVDCAGPDISATTLDEICDAINVALGAAAVASHDSHRITLTSPTAGAESRIELPPAPAADARARLLGSRARTQGRGAAAASGRFVGRADLSATADLSVRRILRLQVDAGAEQEIDCSGDQPDATSAIEIVSRINGALAATIASTDGRRITLTSPTSGPDSRIEVLTPDDLGTDATAIILGVAPRTVTGTLPDSAVLHGALLEEPLDLRRLRKLWLGIDGGPIQEIDIAGPDPAHTTLIQVADKINDLVGTTVALPLDHRLVLQSPTAGAESAIVLRAPVQHRPRFFYTRGRVREDAATTIFGFAAGKVMGRLPEPARLSGTVDLSRGADLRVGHTLLIQLDDRDPLEIFVANPARPLVTTLDKVDEYPGIVAIINGPTGFNAPVASIRNGKLELTSVAEGPSGRIALGVSSASDAGMLIFGIPAESAAYGRAADQVKFVGMGDLARGLDIHDTFLLRVGVDERPVATVDLRDGRPAGAPLILSPAQVAIAINQVLGGSYASHDGRRIVITSKREGSASRVAIELAGEHDATAAVFGLGESRTYEGQGATQARLVGTLNLSNGVQLGMRRHITLEIDGTLVADIDCADKDSGPTALASLVKRINSAAKRDVAGELEGMLAILSPSRGAGSSVVLRLSNAADARKLLLGEAPTTVLGVAGQPAELRGIQKLNRPVDLSRRSLIQLRLDGGKIQEIDCAGEQPARTFSDQIVASINTLLPGSASIDAEQHLVIRAPLSIELLAQRHFTLYEFAPVPARSPDQELRYGVSWTVESSSVRAEPAEWVLRSLSGVDRPRLTNRDTGAWVMVNAVVPAGFTLRVRLDDEGVLKAWMEAPGRPTRDLTDRVAAGIGAVAEPAERIALMIAMILSLPSGSSRWLYTDCYGDRYNAAYFGQRPRRGRPRQLSVVPAHFAGGEVCHAAGVFNLSRFYNKDQPGTETVFGTRAAQARPQAISWFSYWSHQAGRFELELPADLPPQFGGRFNQARFAARDALTIPKPNITYRDAIFDLPQNPKALQEQIEARPNIIIAHDTFIEREEVRTDGEFPIYKGAPIYSVPFTVPRPLVGGGPESPARAYLEQPGVEFAVELIAGEPGAWGNLIQVSAPESQAPGGFDVAISYTGTDVFENARTKVAAQVALARAAGVLGEVTRR